VKKYISFLALAATLAGANDDLFDESLEDLMSMESELQATVGSRDKSRSAKESKVPIDVISAKEIQNSGLTSLVDILHYSVAGFNAPKPSISDGSDHVRAFSLRGMSPDQILVLINGKRLHNSALLHVNGTIGRGSSNVDLDTIAVNAIEKIEILRDGAAAQYGSDAISGVINIILKGSGYENSVSSHAGVSSRGDGAQYEASTFLTKALQYDGFVNLSLEAQKSERAQRAGDDTRLTPPYKATKFGEPEVQNYKALLNSLFVQESGIELYLEGLFNYRDSKSNAFFRPPSAESTMIYPNGFLPIMQAKIYDASATAGVKGKAKELFEYDVSNTYGSNVISYYMSDTMNYSLGAASPTSFYDGSLIATQNSTNLDIKKNIDQLSLAGGLEYRYETYEIKRGDASSYYVATGHAGGSQGFSGYRPTNEVDVNRNSYALYLDSTYNFENSLSLEGAARYESFSDFGSTTNVKGALSFMPSEKWLLRGSASTGFRAPSLAQSYYSQTSTYVDSTGAMTTQGTFRVDHPVSESLGAEALKPEKSYHATFGSTYEILKDLNLMADFFYITVKDRIMLSDELSVSAPMQAQYGVSKARFFTNAIDTKTQGFDIKASYEYKMLESVKMYHQLWFNYSSNEITRFNANNFSETNSFDQIVALEDGQPKDTIKFLSSAEYQKLTTTLNISRYGSYSEARNGKKYNFDPLWSTDIDIAYDVTPSLKIALGGTNIFDTMPSKWDNLSGAYIGTDGIIQYSKYSPIGYTGAYYYARLNYEF
jgi:iron complex outermembrane recepter protein